MIKDAPHVRLLIAVSETLQQITPDEWLENTGLPLEQKLTIRYARNRKPVKSEKPCISLIFVSAEAVQADVDLSAFETQKRMLLDMQCDLDLDPEDGSVDPTGLGMLSRILGYAMTRLQNEEEPYTPIFALSDRVGGGAYDPEERATSEDGRLVLEANVVYRVLSTDENHLLAQGVNG
jgi:hypothetical protein